MHPNTKLEKKKTLMITSYLKNFAVFCVSIGIPMYAMRKLRNVFVVLRCKIVILQLHFSDQRECELTCNSSLIGSETKISLWQSLSALE